MAWFSIGGRRIGYLDTAEDLPAPRARPDRVLVLLHAFPLNADMWASQLSAVPPGWRFIAPHFPGFGDSADAAGEAAGQPAPGQVDAMADPSIDDYARDVLALLDRLAIERAAIAGLSMGGYVAFALARLAADRLTALVLADTKAAADTDEARGGRQELMELAAREGVGAVVDRMVPRLLSETTRGTRPDIEQRVRGIARVSTSAGVVAALRRMMARPDSTALLADIDKPALVIVGELDAVTPPAEAYRMYESIPGARLGEISGAGHLSNLEQPTAFNAALTQFLHDLR